MANELRCRICGGILMITPGSSVAICDSCGSPQPLPRVMSDDITQRYNKAERLRSVNKDYEAARKEYEELLNNDPTEPEANWGMVFCEYGIQYAEDPATRQRIPTLNRMQARSILENPFFLKAIENADPQARAIYEREGKIIDRIQSRYNAVAAKEKPYDVFISYKDSVDGSDQKTKDHDVANRIYEGLVDRGLRVFFSDRTLKGKAVGDYEPYIYAALESARYMLVIGSKAEYFNAEWVRNEWSRFLHRIAEGQEKYIVPIYFDCDITEIPGELVAKNQAYDYRDSVSMGTLLEKVVSECEHAKNAVHQIPVTNAAPSSQHMLMKQRMFACLGTGDWQGAYNACDTVLRAEPTCAEAYLAALMWEFRCCRRQDLGTYITPLNESRYYQNLMQYADRALREEISSYEAQIRVNIEKNKKTKARKGLVFAIVLLILGAAAAGYWFIIRPQQKEKAAEALLEEGSFEEAYEIYEEIGKPEMISKSKYERAKEALEGKDFEIAYALLREIGDYKDAEELLNESMYSRGKALLESGDYAEGYALLEAVGNYQGADQLVTTDKYERAAGLATDGAYDEAIALYDSIADYEDSKDRARELRKIYAEIQTAAGDYMTAYNLYLELGDQEAADALAEEHQWVSIATKQPGDKVFFGHYEQDNNAENGKEEIEWAVLDVQEDRVLLLSCDFLEKQKFTEMNGATNWQVCTLREMMNETMYNEMFSEEEKERVLLSTVTSETSAQTEGNGKDTEDYLFLLSYDEYEQYQEWIPNGDATTFAADRPGEVYYWVLRTNYVSNGQYYVKGREIDHFLYESYYYRYIRPAFWFDITPHISEDAAGVPGDGNGDISEQGGSMERE